MKEREREYRQNKRARDRELVKKRERGNIDRVRDRKLLMERENISRTRE